MGQMPRFVAPTDASKPYLLAHEVMSIPRVETDALVAFLGMGETKRLSHAVRCWRKDNLDYLLIAGPNLNEKTAYEISLDTLRGDPFRLQPDEEYGVITRTCDNTLQQAQWAAEVVRAKNIESLTITAPAYHLPRAYLTLLKQLLVRKLKIALIPDPTPMSPFELVPELGTRAIDMKQGEIDRIIQYQVRGDVATYEECLKYLEWLYEWIEVESDAVS